MNSKTRNLASTGHAADFSFLNGRNILITGGTGSFGRAFTREILEKARPQRLIIFSRDELKQYEMAQDFVGHPQENTLRFFIGDVRDQSRLEMALHDVEFVVHAAALKQVPTAEYNPFECIHTNVLGAENVVRAALRCGVTRVMALSTDKAASPLNLYGASKLASDKIFVAANNLAGARGTRFAVARYGNVLGSRGSVVPLFRRLIADGATALPVTDERMTRFWITLERGVDFVVSCLQSMKGGEIFVPKIPSSTIVDLAKAMAPHLPVKVIGIRPGEKLHEVMITEDDARNTIDLADRYVIEPAFAFWDRDAYGKNLQSMPEGFRYGSDNNPDRLNADQVRDVLGVDAARAPKARAVS
jgi:UDP-N-acetylglucosamine 4,6-dehydratase/5-epimerase